MDRIHYKGIKVMTLFYDDDDWSDFGETADTDQVGTDKIIEVRCKEPK